MNTKMTLGEGGDMAEPKGAGRSARLNFTLKPEVLEGAREVAAELGISTNSWVALAVGRALRQHRMEREILQEVMTKVFGEQMMLEIERQAQEDADAQTT